MTTWRQRRFRKRAIAEWYARANGWSMEVWQAPNHAGYEWRAMGRDARRRPLYRRCHRLFKSPENAQRAAETWVHQQNYGR